MNIGGFASALQSFSLYECTNLNTLLSKWCSLFKVCKLKKKYKVNVSEIYFNAA
jgi:hypothetical protein